MPTQITYNPGILGDEELARSFVVRQQTLDMIMEALRENTDAPTNRHLLFIGPRGIGKTMLVRRAAAAVRSDSEYRSKWYPLVFGEESYPVSTPGEFWLEALFHLVDQTSETRFEKALHELRSERDDARLRERALSQLLDFSDREKKKILLVVENLNTLVGKQMEHDDAWDLRHTLLNEPRLMLLGTATNRFDEIENSGHAWFEMFSVHKLETLNLDDCGLLWQSITGSPLERNPLKAIRILTGGNPRLITILASFAANHSFRQLMEQLVHLIDDHTEYFRGHLETLSAQEQRVFVALLERWDPGGAAELAEQTRLSVNEVSTLLGRLCDRGAAEVALQHGRKKLYQAAERLYNIYYLMRRRGHPEGRVRAAVQFMVTFYERSELVTRLGELAREACSLPAGMREDHYRAFTQILRQMEHLKPEVLEAIPPEFLHAADAELTRVVGIPSIFSKGISLVNNGQINDAEKLFQHVLDQDSTNGYLWMGYGYTQAYQDRWLDAEESFAKAAVQAPSVPHIWRCLGLIRLMLAKPIEAEPAFQQALALGDNETDLRFLAAALADQGRWRESEELYLKLASRLPQDSDIFEALARARHQQRQLPEAEQAIRKAIELSPSGDRWKKLGLILGDQGRWQEARGALSKATDLNPEDSASWNLLGLSASMMKDWHQAVLAHRRAIQLKESVAVSWNLLGFSLMQLGEWGEAEEAFRKAVQLGPGEADHWENLANLLSITDRAEEAEHVWKEALDLHGEKLASNAFHYLELQLKRGVEVSTILHEAESWVARSKRDPDTMVAMSRFVVHSGLTDGLPIAETWAREAFQNQPDPSTAETMAVVLGELNRWKEAIQSCVPMLDATADDEQAREVATEFLIRAAGAGWANEALDAIRRSKGAIALEPLAVGIEIFLGQEPVVAKEIFEVGCDVADRIRAVAQSGAFQPRLPRQGKIPTDKSNKPKLGHKGGRKRNSRG